MPTDEEARIILGSWRAHYGFGESEEDKELRIQEAKEKSLEFKKNITKKSVRK